MALVPGDPTSMSPQASFEGPTQDHLLMAAATMHSLGRLDVLAMMDEKNNPYGKIPGEGGGGSGEIVKFPGSRAKTLDNAMNKMLNAPDAAAADRTKTLLRRVLGSDNVIPMSGK